jgi:hypothetical protein
MRDGSMISDLVDLGPARDRTRITIEGVGTTLCADHRGAVPSGRFAGKPPGASG